MVITFHCKTIPMAMLEGRKQRHQLFALKKVYAMLYCIFPTPNIDLSPTRKFKQKYFSFLVPLVIIFSFRYSFFRSFNYRYNLFLKRQTYTRQYTVAINLDNKVESHEYVLDWYVFLAVISTTAYPAQGSYKISDTKFKDFKGKKQKW